MPTPGTRADDGSHPGSHRNMRQRKTKVYSKRKKRNTMAAAQGHSVPPAASSGPGFWHVPQGVFQVRSAPGFVHKAACWRKVIKIFSRVQTSGRAHSCALGPERKRVQLAGSFPGLRVSTAAAHVVKRIIPQKRQDSDRTPHLNASLPWPLRCVTL